jgi:alpha-glucosidase
MKAEAGLLSAPHHDGSSSYVGDEAPALGDTVTVFVRAPGARTVQVRSTPDGEPRFAAARPDGGGWWRADVEVRNPVTSYRFLVDGRWLTAAGMVDHDVPDATDFRLVAYPAPPAWSRDAVVYQIFPDRFARSAASADRPVPDWAIPCSWERDPVIPRGPETPHQLYGGDLDGIVERLDHVADLGANTVYLTPVFPARSNHRYDASTFDRVDPLLGGDEAYRRLSDAVHARGWRLLGDITTNHTGEAHPWFADPELYYFGPDGGYESWLGVSSLPKLNWGSEELRRRMAEVMARWLRPPYNLDGWRVDVANMTGRRGADAYTHEVAALLRHTVTAARPDALLVAEHAHDASGDLDRDGWHGTMNYAGFTRPLWSWLRREELDLPDFLGVPGVPPRRGGPAVLATMRAFGAQVSWRSLTHSWHLLGSHDTTRIRTVVGDARRGEVAAGLLFTLPGTPMVFAGDELGLTGTNGEGSRTPMPWRRRDGWDKTTLGYYRDLIALRHRHAALRHGGLRWAYADDDALVFLRETRHETVLVLARRAAGTPIRLPLAHLLPRDGSAGTAANVYGGAPDLHPAADGTVTLPADGPTFQSWTLTR